MMTNEEQMTLIKIKSLLYHIYYFIRDEDKNIISDYHELCRKHASIKCSEDSKIK